jgi:hypothetical protein
MLSYSTDPSCRDLMRRVYVGPLSKRDMKLGFNSLCDCPVRIFKSNGSEYLAIMCLTRSSRI